MIDLHSFVLPPAGCSFSSCSSPSHGGRRERFFESPTVCIASTNWLLMSFSSILPIVPRAQYSSYADDRLDFPPPLLVSANFAALQ